MFAEIHLVFLIKKVKSCWISRMILDEVGFEPTSANTVDLKSTPLDQTRALILALITEF